MEKRRYRTICPNGQYCEESQKIGSIRGISDRNASFVADFSSTGRLSEGILEDRSCILLKIKEEK